MKKINAFFLLLMLLTSLTAMAYATNDPVKVKMELSKTVFTMPEEITISIHVTNSSEKNLPGPVILYDPDGKQVEEFVCDSLTAGETRTWRGSWQVTQEQLEAGRVIFQIRYYTYNEAGELVEKNKSFMKFVLLTRRAEQKTNISEMTTFYLYDLGLSIDIPNDYVTITRDTDVNAPEIAEMKVDMEFFFEDGFYLSAIKKEENDITEINIKARNFDGFEGVENSLQEIMNVMVETTNSMEDISMELAEITKRDQVEIAKAYLYQIEPEKQIIQYTMIYNNKYIVINMNSRGISSEKEAIMDTVMESVHFQELPEQAVTKQKTATYEYEDSHTGCRFTIPKRWELMSASEENGKYSVMFSSKENASEILMYVREDMYMELPLYSKAILSREQINNTMFTVENVVAESGMNNAEGSMVTYGGKEYFKITGVSEYNNDIKIIITSMINIEQGYINMFMYSGDESSIGYADFEAMMESVVYP